MFLLVFVKDTENLDAFFYALIFVFASLLILDLFNVFLRTLINKAEFNKFKPEGKPLPERTQILFENQDILSLGVTKGQLEIMLPPSNTLSLPLKE